MKLSYTMRELFLTLKKWPCIYIRPSKLHRFKFLRHKLLPLCTEVFSKWLADQNCACSTTLWKLSSWVSYFAFVYSNSDLNSLWYLECHVGRWLSKWLADRARQWSREAALRMPEARGDIREIVGQPVFVPLYKLYLVYGGVFRLSFGPKTFVIVSDREVAKQILVTNAAQYSKGILSEILDFVMGQVYRPHLRSLCFFHAWNLVPCSARQALVVSSLSKHVSTYHL